MSAEVNTMSEFQPVHVVDGARTPFLKARGRRGPFSASDLAVSAGRPLLAASPSSAGPPANGSSPRWRRTDAGTAPVMTNDISA